MNKAEIVFEKIASTRLIREAVKGKFIEDPRVAPAVRDLFWSGLAKHEIGKDLARETAFNKKLTASSQKFMGELADSIKGHKREIKSEPDIADSIKSLMQTEQKMLKSEKSFLTNMQTSYKKSRVADLKNGKEWKKQHAKDLKKLIQ